MLHALRAPHLCTANDVACCAIRQDTAVYRMLLIHHRMLLIRGYGLHIRGYARVACCASTHATAAYGGPQKEGARLS